MQLMLGFVTVPTHDFFLRLKKGLVTVYEAEKRCIYIESMKERYILVPDLRRNTGFDLVYYLKILNHRANRTFSNASLGLPVWFLRGDGRCFLKEVVTTNVLSRISPFLLPTSVSTLTFINYVLWFAVAKCS